MNKIIVRLNQINYMKIIWILAINVTIHNFEEVIWLPSWSQTIGIWHWPVGSIEFRFAVTVVTIILYILQKKLTFVRPLNLIKNNLYKR